MSQRYVVVGAGGTGTHLLPQLLAYLSTHHKSVEREVWELGVIDGDAVEPKNLARQLFQPHAINTNKAEAAIASYEGNFKNLVAIPEYLGRENISRYVEDGSIVLICVDNYPVRALIEAHCKGLQNVVVINGGNEVSTGTCQIWIRKDGQNLTPPISFLHDEILAGGPDRAEMSCEAISQLDGGEQLIVTNMASAMYMLTALLNYHNAQIPWTEVEFDLVNVTKFTNHRDLREFRGWQ